jgi:hypothetical protein
VRASSHESKSALAVEAVARDPSTAYLISQASHARACPVPTFCQGPIVLVNMLPLERGGSNCYAARMRFEIARRLFVIVLSVALATGLATRASQAIAMDVKTAVAAGATSTLDAPMPMSGKCIGCAGSEKAMASAVCSAFCGGAMASLSVVVAFSPVCVDTVEPSIAAVATGHAFPPDPYPPRPAILS